MLANVEMVVDKMHMRGHIDEWCKQNCDPRKFDALAKVMVNVNLTILFFLKVDTEVCEQVFSWLSRYSHRTPKMSQHTFMFFIVYY